MAQVVIVILDKCKFLRGALKSLWRDSSTVLIQHILVLCPMLPHLPTRICLSAALPSASVAAARPGGSAVEVEVP